MAFEVKDIMRVQDSAGYNDKYYIFMQCIPHIFYMLRFSVLMFIENADTINFLLDILIKVILCMRHVA